MWAHCDGPVWDGEDFSHCFRQKYLQTLLPLIACASSIFVLTAIGALRAIQWKKVGRDRRASQAQLIAIDSESTCDEDEDDSITDLTLQKTISNANASILDFDKPRGEVVLVVVELLALLGQIILSGVLLVDRNGSKSRSTPVNDAVTMACWGYLAVLAIVRLYRSVINFQTSVIKLWSHSAILYGIQWLCGILVFRSILIHSPGQLVRNVEIARFALSTLLATTVLISRPGNERVLLEYDGDIIPSKEPLASVLSQLTFSWVDAVVWSGFKKTLELEDVWNVTFKDKAETALANFRQVAKAHKLALRLFIYFKKPLLIQGAWCVVGSVFMFMPTLLLKAILEYLEDPDRISVNTAWLYVILLLVTGIIQTTSDGQGLWIGRRICIQLRGIIIGEIYSKVLRRKAAAAADSDLGHQKPPTATSFWKRVKFWGRKTEAAVPTTRPLPDAQVNNGTVINLMSIDSFKVSEVSSYLHFLWASVPVQLVMAVTLLYQVLGYSSFAGIGLMILLLPLNLFIAKGFTRAQKRIMAATDKRIHATNEVLQNIRIIKYFAWEQRFAANVNEKRKIELNALWRKYVLWSTAATVWSGVPILITLASFLLFTLVEKKRLVPSIAFPALSMFSLLRVPLDMLADMVAHVQESKVSIDRVEEFLKEDETEKYDQIHLSKQASPLETRIALQNATLAWSTDTNDDPNDGTASFRLIDVNVEFVVGKLNIIVGPTGCGKTSLLMALLGEMKLLEGQLLIPGGQSRQNLRPDPETGLTESVAYCAQQAWLANDTIKQNILFASPYNHQRYQAVITACALSRDLQILDAGDQTLVGEKGITLSGGQKQRISLARALYSTSKHVLLDDCLSAVDSHTAKHIFEQALTGNLMLGRTCILVSHNVSLTVPLAEFVVVLGNGKVLAQGRPDTIIESGALGEDIMRSRPTSKVPSPIPSRTASDLSERVSHLSGQQHQNGNADASKFDTKKQNTDTRKESKATGSVKIATIKSYLSAMGPWYYWIFAVFGFVAVQLGSVATNVWIREWANAYTQQHTRHVLPHDSNPQIFFTPLQFGRNAITLPQTPQPHNVSLQLAVDHTHHVDAKYYLGIYALIGAIYIFLCFAREIVLFLGSLRASWALHDKLLNSILRATFRFFDSTPLGQLTNRFSKDVQSIDQEVAPVAIGLFHSAAAVTTIVILITAITPGFLIPGFFIACLYVATGFFYIRSSRDLKRIESVQRSPLFQHFGETLSGVVTIRAYGDEARFVAESHQRVNTHNRPFLYLWAANRWLALRIDWAGALVSFFSAVFVVMNVGKIDAGTAGLSLSYAITFTQNVLWLVRLYASNEQNMNAVERLQEYIDVEQEAPANIPDTKPPENWPSHGTVEFIGYGTRYRKDLELVLRKLTFKISAGEKVGIVGRTGAGKSSLALALFRGLEAEEGKILIDDVNIGLIGLQDLRESITIVPQDPTLFSGTLRSNLDPFELFTDEDILTALRRVQLITSNYSVSETSLSTSEVNNNAIPAAANGLRDTKTRSSPIASTQASLRNGTNNRDNKNIFTNLSSPIAESGSNLSQGQRQLLCLARALLKSPKVLIMDEATASIDYATDSKIQDTLRELKDNTIITIAHRLQTIIDYDKVLVLDKGELVEYADPWELIRKEDGIFRSMCETSGDMENLMVLARRSFEERQLIDVSG